MTDLDHLVSTLGEDATYGPEAADRLGQRLAVEPPPRIVGRRRTVAAALAFAVAATLGGGTVGAFMELSQAPLAAPVLPAGQSGTAASLLFGDR